ncbi:MAG: hypothetical protein P4N41_17275 [Negativicutes bacterium]|nr:hypothetical protein [Negativicutes bacterium]
MAQSRRIRKQEQDRLIVCRVRSALAAIFSAALLASAWTWGNNLIFTLMTAILFWGTLLGNPYGVRGYLPWLNSSSRPVRTLAPLLYLLIVLTIISSAGG